jgi:outer membrane protein OmpA-like peptidoglycan-associated protein
MKRILSLSVLAIFFYSTSNAQLIYIRSQKEFNEDIFERTTKKQYAVADEYWLDENYDFAIKIYNNIKKDVENTAFLSYKLGNSYANAALYKNNDSAMFYLSEAVKNVTKEPYKYSEESSSNIKSPVFAYLDYGRMLRNIHKIDDAENYFQMFEESWGNDMPRDLKKIVDKEFEICKTAKLLIANPIDISVTPLENVNSEYPEFAPVISADEQTLIFTSRRKLPNLEGKQDKDPFDFGYYEDIFISTKTKEGKWGEPKLISDKINTEGHEASIGLSVDGQQLLIYSSQLDASGDIYYSKLEGSEWTKPVPFEALNSKAKETHACFSADGKIVYFASDRKGGYGGFDIYRVTMLPNGQWSEPLNLGSKINTEYDDRSPFIHPDGVSLFFSSNGHETMGGLDIFQSTDLGEEGWSTPENVGYPINTTEDDAFFVTSVDGKRSYYASEKDKGLGGKDLYMISIPKPPVQPMTVMSGVFSLGEDGGTIPADAQIIVKDNQSGDIVGIYKPNTKTGKYLFILPPGKNYNVTYEAKGYLFKSENLIVPKNSAFQSMKKEIKLAAIKADESIILNNVFFEFGSAKISNDSKSELNKLFSLLSNNPSISVEIQGHTDSKGNNKFNKKLSQERAESVQKFLTNKGIKKLRVSAVGYGEKQPIAKNTNEDGSDNEEGRALNRRIELKILKDGKVDSGVVKEIKVDEKLKR